MDLQCREDVDFVNFVKYALGECLENLSQNDAVRRNKLLPDSVNLVLPLCNSKGVKRLVKKYCASVAMEGDRYAPFVKLCNTTLEGLGNLQVADKNAESFKSLGLREPDPSIDGVFYRNDQKRSFANTMVLNRAVVQILLLSPWTAPSPAGEFHRRQKS
ncbi:hypothetical protein BDQ12DRAFT_718191 [Crucibulum laeve]|uniref:Uncharacterized protein n=1 Tax=Crucibulum laeve TaxID=68775 RepID=A0A5C3MK61_9AGAR|nr:hypothetical protein BDQ12DRAFT_718191 [Crucibulum laeve]